MKCLTFRTSTGDILPQADAESIIKKLFEYESTGLTPEEIQKYVELKCSGRLKELDSLKNM